jgi:hypothetical protein
MNTDNAVYPLDEEHPFSVEVDAFVKVRITIRTPSVVKRCVDDEDGWRTLMYYPLDTPTKVYEHLAFNAIRNGISDAQALDGWADLEVGDCEMEITDVDPEGWGYGG